MEHSAVYEFSVVLCERGRSVRVHQLLADQRWLSDVFERALECQVGPCEVAVFVLDREPTDWQELPVIAVDNG